MLILGPQKECSLRSHAIRMYSLRSYERAQGMAHSIRHANRRIHYVHAEAGGYEAFLEVAAPPYINTNYKNLLKNYEHTSYSTITK